MYSVPLRGYPIGFRGEGGLSELGLIDAREHVLFPEMPGSVSKRLNLRQVFEYILKNSGVI